MSFLKNVCGVKMVKLNQRFVVYWVALMTQVIAALFMYQQGIFTMLFAADPTGISALIFVIHVVAFVWMGYATQQNHRESHVVSYVSDVQLGLGMTGTLIGFVIMFSTVFVGITTEEDVANALGLIATGVGTALWTTLTGLISSLILKGAVVNLER